ncbi:alpha/beta hydrolase [Ancylobacter radicis]|uniref:Alpha/beta hydrolase n=1 Tax=Ancylobacter radicis TaxID=2836179 RepID=A0ABS5R2S1_9HYPH|nr:alpha/beta hydrolase-fold protein [Ancylobacter radicis]MBS9475916.1 alpha/beta hydrolase [Ancylobacter radicis]
MPALTVPDAEWFDLAPARGGAAYRIFLARPRGAPPPGGFPLMLMLDANAAFATFVEVMRRGAGRPQATGIEDIVLVGIGYPEDEDRSARRTVDYTAGPSAEMRADPPASRRTTGGRDAFLAVIKEEVLPRIATMIPVDTARRTLFGHSLGGWFTLDVALRDPTAFAAYVAVSPSIWWDEPRLIEGLARAQGQPLRLSLMVGEWEEAMAPWQLGGPSSADMAARRAARGMVSRAEAFAARAAAQLGPLAQVEFTLLAGEDHASVLPPAMARALRFAQR